MVRLIEDSRKKAFQAVNTTLIELYWRIGETISLKIAAAEWGDGVIEELARFIARKQPSLRGFTRANLFRMRQFYDTYRDDEKVAPLVRQLPWTHNLIILGQTKRSEEREFYLRQTIAEHWSKRELERQMKAALFERSILTPVKSHQRCDKLTQRRRMFSKTPTCWSFWTCLQTMMKQICIAACCSN